MKTKRVSVFGSTGSIGVNALDVARRSNGLMRVVALSAGANAELLARQAEFWRPEIVCIGTKALAARIRARLPRRTRVVYGPEGLLEMAGLPGADTALFAIAGSACLQPLLASLDRVSKIALANKESLVSAGGIIMRRAARRGVSIVPIDSEHSAVFQCLAGRRHELSRIILTASGGPLRTVARARFDRLPRSAILKHPKWRMGRKISVDSATMMNKGLEVIEACRLFNVPERQVDVVVHPEAIIHSMVELIDRSILAQLGVPDMRMAIQYALTHPERLPGYLPRLDLARIGRLTFEKPDPARFPCLDLARSAVRAGGLAPSILTAANEEAVHAYLDGSLTFTQIPVMIEKVLSRHRGRSSAEPSIHDVFEAEAWAREQMRSLCCH